MGHVTSSLLYFQNLIGKGGVTKEEIFNIERWGIDDLSENVV